MGDLDKRLRALEAGDSSACPECGITLVEGRVTFELWEPLRWDEEPPKPEFCPRCGQMVGGAFTLDLGDAPVRSWPEGEDAEDW